MKSLIRDIRHYEREANLLEWERKLKILSIINEALVLYFLIRLVEIEAQIVDHAQNASDRMRRTMIER